MADLKISQLPSATTPLAGTEALPIVQSNATKQVSIANLTAGAVKSNATTGVLQVVGPAAASTRVMTTPDANFNVARTDAAQTFTGDQIITGSVTSSVFKSSSGVVSALSGVPTTIATFSGTNASCFVCADIFSGAPGLYLSTAIVMSDANVLNNAYLFHASKMDITVSGGNIQCTQLSGATQDIRWSITQLS